MHHDHVTLRRAEPGDTIVILGLIRELADYERLAHEVVADEDRLAATLFGPRPYAEALLAEYGDTPAGFALFFHNYSTFLGKPGLYLEDLFVRPACRGLGIGHRLFTAVAEVARERDCERMEWSVLNWNEPAIDFYERAGAVRMAEWSTYRLTETALDDLLAGARASSPGRSR